MSVTVNCCQCFEGVNMDLEIYVQCFNCGHHLDACCPRVGDPKPGQMVMNAYETGTNSSSSEASASISSTAAWNLGSHGSYHSGYHYHK